MVLGEGTPAGGHVASVALRLLRIGSVSAGDPSLCRDETLEYMRDAVGPAIRIGTSGSNPWGLNCGSCDLGPATERHDVCVSALARLDARNERKAAEELLQPTGTLVRGAGEVVSYDPGSDGMTETLQPAIYRALENPTSVSVEAAERRLSACLGAQVLEPAVDAAVSAQASNSIEKMFCHQMAAAHHHAMKHLERSLADRLPPAEQVRYTNAAARLMDVYREGLLAWRRLKCGTTQTVVVQHVQVASGGQALVAGSLKHRRGKTRVAHEDGEQVPNRGKTP
jgi:hypothetical protein